MDNYQKHAQREFLAAGWCDEEGKFNNEMQEMICTHVMELLELFSSEGHSGSSAPYAIDLFRKLAGFEPLVPLTGEDYEWNEVREGVYQNNRCSHVFKDESGVYDSQGIIFRQPNGSCYQSEDSQVYIEFPYTPITEYVDVEE